VLCLSSLFSLGRLAGMVLVSSTPVAVGGTFEDWGALKWSQKLKLRRRADFGVGDTFCTVLDMFTHEDASLTIKRDKMPVGTRFIITEVQFPNVKITSLRTPSEIRGGVGPSSGWICGAVARDKTRRWEKDLPLQEFRPIIKLVQAAPREYGLVGWESETKGFNRIAAAFGCGYVVRDGVVRYRGNNTGMGGLGAH